MLFFLILFVAAFLASIPLAIKNGKKPTGIDLGYGSVVGVLNAIANLGLISALNTIPGSIAFPLFSSLGLLATVVMSMILLHERINKINAFGIVMCLCAVILINF